MPAVRADETENSYCRSATSDGIFAKHCSNTQYMTKHVA